MPTLRIQIIALTVIRTVLNTMHRMVYPFLPALGRGLGVDIQSLSLALTARSAAGIFGPFFASVADSRGRKAGMIFGMMLFTAGITLVVLWPVYPTFVAALIMAALGKYAFDPSMQAYLGDRVAYNRRGLALAITELSWSLSFIVGVPLAGFLIARGGWIAPFPLLAGLGLVSIFGLIWLLPPDPVVQVKGPGLLRNIRSVFSYTPALAGLGVGLTISMSNEVVNLVFGVWMEDSFGLQIAALGAASAVIGISELGGESFAGLLSDRLGKERAIAIGLVLNSAAAVLLPIIGYTIPGALVGLFLFYITFEFALVCIIPLMTEIMPAARATIMAANIASLSLGRAMGALAAPLLYSIGFGANASAALVLNILAFFGIMYLLRIFKSKVNESSQSPP
jgi:MFS transporter, DHA1 family, inner membrane transport protein